MLKTFPIKELIHHSVVKLLIIVVFLWFLINFNSLKFNWQVNNYEFLIKGFSINEKRLTKQNEQLKELQHSVKILGKIVNQKELSNGESLGLLKIISDYAYALDILDQYDYQTLKIEETSGKETYQLSYKEAIKQIQAVKQKYGNSELFGREKDNSFQSSVSTIYQTFDGKDLYPSIE